MVEQVRFAFLPGKFDRPFDDMRRGNRCLRQQTSIDSVHIYNLSLRVCSASTASRAPHRENLSVQCAAISSSPVVISKGGIANLRNSGYRRSLLAMLVRELLDYPAIKASKAGFTVSA